MNILLQSLFHWLHLVAAITALGGTIFMVMVTFPVLGRLGEEVRAQFLERAHGKVMMLTLHSFGLLIVTGFINMIRVFTAGRPTDLYNLLLVAKVFLALGLFAIGLMLFLPSDALKDFQARRPFWMRVNAILGLIIVFLSGWMRLEGQYNQKVEEIYPDEETISVEIPDSVDI
jgi:hypothetical protein